MAGYRQVKLVHKPCMIKSLGGGAVGGTWTFEAPTAHIVA